MAFSWSQRKVNFILTQISQLFGANYPDWVVLEKLKSNSRRGFRMKHKDAYLNEAEAWQMIKKIPFKNKKFEIEQNTWDNLDFSITNDVQFKIDHYYNRFYATKLMQSDNIAQSIYDTLKPLYDLKWDKYEKQNPDSGLTIQCGFGFTTKHKQNFRKQKKMSFEEFWLHGDNIGFTHDKLFHKKAKNDKEREKEFNKLFNDIYNQVLDKLLDQAISSGNLADEYDDYITTKTEGKNLQRVKFDILKAQFLNKHYQKFTFFAKIKNNESL